MKITLFVTICMLALTATQLRTAEASPPPEVGGPGVCVNPSSKDYRCNTNDLGMSEQEKAEVLASVMAHKQRTIDQVAAGEMEAYMSQFTPDVKYYFNDDVYEGYDEVLGFVQSVVGSGRVLTISDVKARVLSARHVTIVSANWKLGDDETGMYLHEDYYRQDNGSWKSPTMSLMRNP